MSLPHGTFEIGPATGRLLLQTRRDGVAARVGHDLTITFETWSGQLTLHGDDVASAAVTAVFETGSIKILEGAGGALPLTRIDRNEIRRTARRLLDVARYPTATFNSTAIDRTDGGGTIDGTLTVRGVAAPVTIAVARDDSGWCGTTSIRQSAFGIKPYRAFLGALRLADEVGVEVAVDYVADADF